MVEHKNSIIGAFPFWAINKCLNPKGLSTRQKISRFSKYGIVKHSDIRLIFNSLTSA